MIQRHTYRAPCRRAMTRALGGLLLPLLAVTALAGGNDTITSGAPAPKSVTAEQARHRATEPARERGESLPKPADGTRPNPEQANPALVNPCHGNPQPKWCGE